MPVPGFYRFESKQYEDFDQILELQQPDGSPFDSTGYSGLLQLRTLDDALAATAALTFPTTSTLRIQLGEAQCLVWPLLSKRYLFDLQLTNPTGGVGYWLEGEWVIRKSVSRP